MYSKLRTNKRPNFLPAYSLVEILISLSIIGVVITILFNSLIVSLKVTIKSLARSSVREEIANVFDLVAKDIKSADLITSCGNTGSSSSCTFTTDGVQYSWGTCSVDGHESICKDKIVAGVPTERVFITSDNLGVDSFMFDKGFNSGENPSAQNILLTIVAYHTNSVFNINNIIHQESISTRNYEY